MSSRWAGFGGVAWSRRSPIARVSHRPATRPRGSQTWPRDGGGWGLTRAAEGKERRADGQGHTTLALSGEHNADSRFMRGCGTLAIQQAFTNDNNPKANADTERIMRMRREDCL